MNVLRIVVVVLLVIGLGGLGTPALAGELRESLARAAEQAAQTESRRIPNAHLWAGTALFVGGLAVGLYAFHNNRNGEFPEFGENEATDQKLGMVGLLTAFAGGAVLYLGTRQSTRSPSVTFSPGRLTVSKQLSW